VSLVCQRLGVSALPEPVASFIREKAGGHPFFSEELAYMLRDSGRIVVTQGECRMAPDTGDLRALSVPDTVQGVLTGRIDRLTPRQQLALKVASVIGREFAFRTLHDIHPIESDKASLGEDLDALAQRDLVQIATLEPDLTYRFKHIITQEVAYNLLPFGHRRQLHRSVGEWYEHTSGGDLSPLSALLAHHWSQAAQATAELAPKAIAYLEKAAEQALGSYANQEALRFLTEALGLDAATHQDGGALGAGGRNGAGLRRARWERQVGEAYYRLGNPAEARVHLTQSLLLLGRRVPSARFKILFSLIGQVGQQALHRLSPAIFIGHARRDKRARLLESARAYETLALVSFIAAETLSSINGNLHGLNLAEAAGPSPELANSYAMVGLLAGLITQARLAEQYFQHALRTAERVDDRSCLGRVWFTKGYYLLGKGEWAAARDALARAYERFEQLGDRRWCETTVLTLANLNYNQGQFARCGELYDQAYESARRRGDVQAQAWAMVAQALVPLPLGRTDAALERVAALDAWLANSVALLSDRATEINAYGIRALAHTRRGERALALQTIEQAVRLIEQSSPSAYYGLTGYGAAAEVTLTLLEASDAGSVEREELQRLADQACMALRNFARLFPIGQPQAWLWKGLRDWLAGKPSRAHAAWQKSLARAERLEMPYEEGLAHFEIGRHLPANDPRWRRHLLRADEIFSQLGAAHHQARVRVTLDSQTCGSLPQLVLSS
jgi:tetratricopeptide (TPR) repeat protein